jgi:hypothetical protein
MAKFLPLMIALLGFGLFALSIITGGIFLAQENNANQSIADNPAISTYAGSLNDSLQSAYDSSSGAEDAISNSPVTTSSSLFIIDAMAGVWKVIKAVPVGVVNLTYGLVTTLWDYPAIKIGLSLVGAILTLTIIIAVWRLLSMGDGG